MPMRTLPIDAAPLNFVSAGTPEPVMVWEDVAGRRTLTDRQEHDEQGRPVWTCYVMATAAERPEVISLRVGADHQPVLSQFGAVTLVGLEVNVRVDKAGKLAQYWSASEVRDAGQGRRQDKPAEAA